MFDKLSNKNLNHVIIYLSFIISTILLLFFRELRSLWTPLVMLVLYIFTTYYFIDKFGTNHKDTRIRLHKFNALVLILTIFLSFTLTYWYLFLILFNLVSLIANENLNLKTEFKNILINLTILVILGMFLFSVYYLFGALFIIYLIAKYTEESIREDEYDFFNLYILSICIFSVIASFINGYFIFLLFIPLGFIKLDYYKNLKFIKTMFFNKSNLVYTIITYCLFFLFLMLISIEVRVITANGKGIPHNTYDVNQVRLIHGDYSLYGYPESGLPNTEHVFARSWSVIDSNESPYVHDLHNLYASDPGVNSARGNMMFGYGSDMYEPDDIWKGNIARVLLYMYVTYPEVRQSGKIDISLMKEWNRLDPVDQGEIIRNNKIDLIGNNPRNIFVDNSWLANFVF